MKARLLLGAFGVLELLFPRTVVDTSMRLATTEDSEFALRPWVYRVARLEGFVIALWAFGGARRSPRTRQDRAPATTTSSASME